MANDDFLDNYLTVGEINDDDEYTFIGSESIFDTEVEPPLEDEDDDEQGNVVVQPVVSDVVTELLKEKGITDPSQIRFENEDGEEEKFSFYDLPVEDQLAILRTEQEQENDLDDEEISLVNYLRQNQLTPDEFLEHIKKQAVEEYLTTQQPLESVADMTDDEIFLTDLFTRVKEITDEEAHEALESAKQNERLYKKNVEAIREDLIEKEKIRKQEEDAIAAEEKAQSFEAFKQSLFDTAPTVKEIAGRIELDEDDINETVDFLLAEDATGTRYIAKALNDPAALLKMAWFYVKGEEAINYMAEYYETQIKEYSKNNYDKGYEDGKNGVVTKRVTTKPKDNKPTAPQYMGIPQNPALLKK